MGNQMLVVPKNYGFNCGDVSTHIFLINTIISARFPGD